MLCNLVVENVDKFCRFNPIFNDILNLFIGKTRIRIFIISLKRYLILNKKTLKAPVKQSATSGHTLFCRTYGPGLTSKSSEFRLFLLTCTITDLSPTNTIPNVCNIHLMVAIDRGVIHDGKTWEKSLENLSKTT